MAVNFENLNGVIPDEVYNQLQDTIDKFEINTPLRLAHFISQCAHESVGFTDVRENLNYSADGLKRVFPNYFPGTLSESYARQPSKIGSHVYADRMGNGDEDTGDGYNYRGRGFLQVTGKENYELFGESINVDVVSNPDIIATDYPLLSAAWFFSVNNILPICDRGSDRSVVESVTKRVNGGLNGIESRWEIFQQYYPLLS